MKTVIAKFTGDNYANVYDVYQWDYGQVLRIEGLKLPKMVEVHFSLEETGGKAVPRIGTTKDGATDVIIPDSMLENEGAMGTYKIYAWVYLTDADSGSTEYKVTIHVKARSKPEIPGGGDNPDILHEAVLAVREYAEKAEEAQRQAEGYAHGREDLPERAEDNAKYYSDKASEDAKKTAQDRTEVERLVESVAGIDEQVAKVEKLSKDAQEAATQAGTTAEQAELHRQAAETAKESVENLSAQVQKNKESVDKTAQDFALNAQQAIADVNNSGQTQTERVQTAGTTAVENIKTAQDTATRAVETAKTEAVKVVQTEGNKQVKAVADKGKEVLESIPNLDAKLDKKLDKNLGAEHAGKALVIGKDGNVVLGEVQTEGVGDAADAIVNTAKGNLLLIKDSSARKNKGFGMSGKTEQFSTRGVNLWDLDSTVIVEGTKSVMFNNPIQAGTYTLSAIFTNNKSAKESLFNFYNAQNQSVGNGSIKHGVRGSKTITLTGEAVKVLFYAGTGHDSSQGVTTTIKDIQLETGNNATEYEPYTGGKPSPSTEYPQEIVNAGRLNEDTGKYEVDVKVTGKNIVNIPDIDANTNATVTQCYIQQNAVVSAKNECVATNNVWHICFYQKNGEKQYFNGPEGSKKIYASRENPIIKFEYRNTYITSGAYRDIMIEYGDDQTTYEPYKEQTLTLTFDRPLTKWDRLVEQDGQIGWLYNSSETILNGTEDWIRHSEINKETTQAFGLSISDLIYGEDVVIGQNGLTDKFRYVNAAWAKDEAGQAINNGRLFINIEKTKASTVEEFKAWLKSNNVKVVYKTKQTEFVPLPLEQQDAIRALTTYYPTTVVSNSEDAEMQLTYVADTKNYTDNKIKEAVSAQTQNLANLLSLMPLSTQAAMIEADTNNILDMEVQK